MTLGNCIINACAVGFCILTGLITVYVIHYGSVLILEPIRWLLPLETVLILSITGLAIYNIVSAIRKR